MSRISLIIFDLDGTVVNSLQLVLDIYEQHLTKEFGCKSLDPSRLEYYRSRSPHSFFRELGITPFKFPFILRRAKKLMNQRLHEIEACPEVPELIRQLHQHGVKLGIVTSNSTRNAIQLMNNHRLTPYFDFIQGSHPLSRKYRVLNRVLKAKQYPKAEVLYVGDEVRDIRASRKAGLHCASVTWGQASRQLLEQHQPDYIFDSPTEILDLMLKEK